MRVVHPFCDCLKSVYEACSVDQLDLVGDVRAVAVWRRVVIIGGETWRGRRLSVDPPARTDVCKYVARSWLVLMRVFCRPSIPGGVCHGGYQQWWHLFRYTGLRWHSPGRGEAQYKQATGQGCLLWEDLPPGRVSLLPAYGWFELLFWIKGSIVVLCMWNNLICLLM